MNVVKTYIPNFKADTQNTIIQMQQRKSNQSQQAQFVPQGTLQPQPATSMPANIQRIPAQMKMPMEPAFYELMQAKKKEERKDTWQKVGVVANAVLAGAFTAIAVAMFLNYKLNKKAVEASFNKLKGQVGNTRSAEAIEKAADDLYKSFEDLSKNKKIVGVNDKSIDKDFRKWVQDLIADESLPEDLTKVFGDEEALANWIFMYGGSGVGKTYNADVVLKALGAKRAKRQFSNFSSKYIGETSVQITQFFEDLECMLKKHPNEKFGVTLDEFETLAKNIENMTNHESHLEQNRTALINGLDAVSKYKNLYLIASSNVGPESGKVDGAIARRFIKNLFMKYPNETALGASLTTHLKRFNQELPQNEIDAFAETLKQRIAGHGDVKTVVEAAVLKAKSELLSTAVTKGAMKKLDNGRYEVVNKDLLKEISANFKLTLKHLEDALAEKGKTAGEMGNAFTEAVA